MLYILLLILPTVCQGQVVGIKGNLLPIEYSNEKRAKYQGTSPFVYSETLQQNAMDCAIQMLEDDSWMDIANHPCNPSGEGENLYTTDQDGQLDDHLMKTLFKAAIDAWESEKYDMERIISEDNRFMDEPYYKFNVKNHGHFTQLVWKGTDNAGCGGAGKPYEGTYKYIIVCRYTPPGNDYRFVKLKNNIPLLSELRKPTLVRCEDKLDGCSKLKSSCGSNFVKKNCMATCGLCRMEPDYHKAMLSISCEDEINCSNLVGFCDLKEVKAKCRATCGGC